MKILIDESLDVRLKRLLDDSFFEVFTVRDMNWLGVKNGELLKRAVSNDFRIFITADKNLKHQQNLSELNLNILLLDLISNDLSNYTSLIPSIINLMNEIKDKSYSQNYFEIKISQNDD